MPFLAVNGKARVLMQKQSSGAMTFKFIMNARGTKLLKSLFEQQIKCS